MTTPVTIDEIIKSINFPSPCKYYNGGLINRIREHGIAQESNIQQLIAEIDGILMDAPDMGVAYSLRRLANKWRAK